MVKVSFKNGEDAGKEIKNARVIYSGVAKGLVESVEIDGVMYDGAAFDVEDTKAEVKTADAPKTKTKDVKSTDDTKKAPKGDILSTESTKKA